MQDAHDATVQALAKGAQQFLGDVQKSMEEADELDERHTENASSAGSSTMPGTSSAADSEPARAATSRQSSHPASLETRQSPSASFSSQGHDSNGERDRLCCESLGQHAVSVT